MTRAAQELRRQVRVSIVLLTQNRTYALQGDQPELSRKYDPRDVTCRTTDDVHRSTWYGKTCSAWARRHGHLWVDSNKRVPVWLMHSLTQGYHRLGERDDQFDSWATAN